MSDLTFLQNCLFDERITNGIIVSSTALFFYDYCLTIHQEIRYVWKTKYTFANVLFVCARYSAFLTAILVLLPSSVVMSNVRSCLRVLAILSSELIFALRAWAIWGRRKSILIMFICATIAGFVPSIIITVKDISSSAVDPRLPPEYSYCEIIVSSVGKLWVLPYLLIISYQLLTLTFTLIKISQLHRSIPLHARDSILRFDVGPRGPEYRSCCSSFVASATAGWNTVANYRSQYHVGQDRIPCC